MLNNVLQLYCWRIYFIYNPMYDLHVSPNEQIVYSLSSFSFQTGTQCYQWRPEYASCSSEDPTSVGMAQHLTNTVFIDRPLQVTPYPEG